MTTLQQKIEESQRVVRKGVLVRFNCTTMVHMIPDAKYEKEKETLETMRYENYDQFRQRLAAGSPYETKMFKNGDEAIIPAWYYKANKNQWVTVPMSNDKFKDKSGNRSPFNGDDAVMHGYIDDPAKTVHKVKKFEKIAGKDQESVETAESQQNKGDI